MSRSPYALAVASIVASSMVSCRDHVLVSATCYWFIGAGDPTTVSSLYMYLWSPAMQRITENRSDTPMSMVGYCASAPGMYKFEAKLNKGKGTYKVGVYAK